MNRRAEELVARAFEAAKRAYAPYSRFQVGAAVLGASGRLYTGANVENASYGACCCAERNAIFHAVAEGERTLVALAVVGGVRGVVTDWCPPCGICRQVMREFADPAAFEVILSRSPAQIKAFRLADLLPVSFGPRNLQEVRE